MTRKTRQSLAFPDLQFGDPKLDRLVQALRAMTVEVQRIQQLLQGGTAGQLLEKGGSSDFQGGWADAVAGAVTGATNIGDGLGIYASLSGTLLQLKSLLSGPNIVLAESADGITISAPEAGAGTVTSVDIESTDLLVVGSPIILSGTIRLSIAPAAVTYAKIQLTNSDAIVLGRGFGEGQGQLEELTLSQVLDLLGTAQQGDVLFRGATGWQYLAAGASGQFLQTQGALADVIWEAAGTGPLILGLDYDLVSNTGWADVTIGCLIKAALLTSFATSWNFGVNVTLGPMLVTACVVRRVLRDTNVYVDSTIVTFGASATPTLATGLNVSDSIAVPIDDAHDYVILLHFDAGVSGTASLPISAGDGSDLASASVSGDHTADADYSAFVFSVDSNVAFYGAWAII